MKWHILKGKKNMKLLRLFNDGKKTEAQFLDLSEMKNGAFDERFYKNIELIENEDVKDLLIYIINNDDSVLDDYDNDAIINPAQNLIYLELFTELTKVLNSKKDIIDKINEQFKPIEDKYNN